MTNGLNGMLGRLGDGMCRLSMSGNIAVKTGDDKHPVYKSYDVNTGRLTNCDNFVFNIGQEFFFVMPTNHVKIGDIILVSGKPKCVIEKPKKNTVKVMDYEDSSIKEMVIERHQFMGNTYSYGKIVSMFGNNLKKNKDGSKKGGPQKIMQWMMLSQMFGKNASSQKNGTGLVDNSSVDTPFGTMDMSGMMPFMLMGGGFGNMFDDMFDFDYDDEEDEDDVEDTDDSKKEE